MNELEFLKKWAEEIEKRMVDINSGLYRWDNECQMVENGLVTQEYLDSAKKEYEETKVCKHRVVRKTLKCDGLISEISCVICNNI